MSNVHNIRDPRTTTQQGRFSDEQLYTLREVEELAREYKDSHPRGRAMTSMVLKGFIGWVRQREVNDGTT